MTMKTRRIKTFVLCLSDRGYAASLVQRRLYEKLPDADAAKRGLVRVIDESWEDYLFPQTLFAAIELPRAIRERLATWPMGGGVKRRCSAAVPRGVQSQDSRHSRETEEIVKVQWASVFVAVLLMLIAFAAGSSLAQPEPAAVERTGIEAELKIEELVSGNLTELNGAYKLRAALVTYEPGGHIGNHHHAGPGLRCVFEGQLTYVQEGVSRVFGPGDCFYEPGNVDHHARNAGEAQVKLFNFQILPKDWEGSSAITVTPAS